MYPEAILQVVEDLWMLMFLLPVKKEIIQFWMSPACLVKLLTAKKC